MKVTYTLIAALLFITLTDYLLSCKDKRPSHESDEQTMAASDTMKVHNLSENHYQDLRKMAHVSLSNNFTFILNSSDKIAANKTIRTNEYPRVNLCLVARVILRLYKNEFGKKFLLN